MNEFGREHFDAMYGADPDPWNFRSSPYEREKYARTLRALPRPRYANLLELGCSIGELTARLARRADGVTAVDVSPIALEEACRTCASLTNVRFVQALLPDGDWEGDYDAVVLSEILYYLQSDALAILARRVVSMAPRADIVLVHWTGDTDYPLGGDEAADRFIGCCTSHVVRVQERAPEYRLDVLSASP